MLVELTPIENEILEQCYDEWKKRFGSWFTHDFDLKEDCSKNDMKKAIRHLLELLILREDKHHVSIWNYGINHYEQQYPDIGNKKKENRIKLLEKLKIDYDEDIDRLVSVGQLIKKSENELDWLTRSEIQYLEWEGLVYVSHDNLLEGYSLRLTSNGENFLKEESVFYE